MGGALVGCGTLLDLAPDEGLTVREDAALRDVGSGDALLDATVASDTTPEDARIQDAGLPSLKLVFVTRDEVNGNLGGGGIAAGDALCMAAAADGGLAGTFIAWLSTTDGGSADGSTVNAIDRLPSHAYWQLPDDAGRVFPSRAFIADGGLPERAIDRDPGGALAGGFAWTCTTVRGTALATGSHCQGWTSAASTDQGFRGTVGATDGRWTQTGTLSCASGAHLLCFEK